MSGNHPPDRRRAHHSADTPSPWEQEVYHEHICGNSYRKLGAKYDCSHEHVGTIVRRVIEWKRPQIRQTINEATDKLIDAHWQAYEQAMQAWEESRGQVVVETITERGARTDKQGNEISGTERKTERRYSSGDTRCLQTAIKALEEYRKIIGYQPPRPDDEDSERVAGKTFDQVIDREMQRLQQIKDRQLGSPN
jgi:hypothetical protein